MRKLFILFLFVSNVGFANPKNQDRLVFLASYPRSGNTLMRYCIEYLTKRPTVGDICRMKQTKYVKTHQQPLAWKIDSLSIDETKPLVVKTHEPMNNCFPMIFLLRDYKEAVVSHMFRDSNSVNLRSPFLHKYFYVLSVFDRIPEAEKILIYYEDFIKFPRRELEKVLTFLGEKIDEEKLNALIQNLPEHKALTSKFYAEFIHRPVLAKDNIHYHAERLKDECKKLDQYAQSLHSELVKKYLQRYQPGGVHY